MFFESVWIWIYTMLPVPYVVANVAAMPLLRCIAKLCSVGASVTAGSTAAIFCVG